MRASPANGFPDGSPGAGRFAGGPSQETIAARQLAARQDVVVVYPLTFKSETEQCGPPH